MQTNAAAIDPATENMEKRNQTSVSDRIRSYLSHPGSGVLALLHDRSSSNYFFCADLPGSIYPCQRYPISDPKSF